MSGHPPSVSICHACQTPTPNPVRAMNGELYHLECNPFGYKHTRGRKSAEPSAERLVEETRPQYALAEPDGHEELDAELPAVGDASDEQSAGPRSEEETTSPELVD